METDVVVAPAESSTPEPTPNFEPSTYSPEEHGVWMATGKVPLSKAESTPAKVEAPKPADPAPANEPADAAKADGIATDSAPVVQQQDQSKGRGAEARIKQLLARNKELEALVTKPPEPVKPAAEAEPKAPKVDKPVKPIFGEKDGETWEDFDKRNDAYHQELIKYALAEDRKAREKERVESETAAANKRVEDSWNERVASAKTKHADFAEVAFSKEVPISPVMDGFVLDSDLGPEILYYFGTHIAEAKSISVMSPYRAARALHDIEKSLVTVEAPPPAAEETQPPKKVSPVVIPITKAAKPATDLKATNSAPADERTAAIEAGDFERYKRIADAADIAKHKRG